MTDEEHDRIARTPGICSQCGKHLSGMRGGMFSGDAMMAMLEQTPYPCKSCRTIFCMDCMAKIKGKSCPSCGNTPGW